MTDGATENIKKRLVEVSGHTTQDLGLGRMVGQVAAYIYFSSEAVSLDEMEGKLNLSKATVSIATRQLERLGVLKRIWIKGDRKNYFKIAENLASALQNGILDLIRSKLRVANEELDYAESYLSKQEQNGNKETKYLLDQLKRAKTIRDSASLLIDNPLVKWMGR